MAGILLVTAGAPAAASAPASIAGVWDLIWQTRKGPRQSGYFVLRQAGDQLSAELHGKGMVKARGTVSGNAFQLSGTRMLVKYRITGTWAGDRMDGSFKVLSTDLKFIGKRRVPSLAVRP